MSEFNPTPLPIAPARLMPLDFSPFNDRLNAFSAIRYKQLDALISGKTIGTLQLMVGQGQVSYEEIAIYYLWRIRHYDPKLNSFISLNPDIITIAQERDAQRRQGIYLGDMHGIPIGLKDNVATHDQMPNTAGAVALRDAYPNRDAFIVQQLRGAGAVIFGKLNLSEWARFMSLPQPNGFSALGGQTYNPYGKQFDTCGSSSGSGVAVSAGLVPVAIGTETSGSIICPACFNSVYGLKPSLGLVSRDYIIPITDAQDTAGVLALHVEDVGVVMNVIRGTDPHDPLTHGVASTDAYPTELYADNGLEGKRVGVYMLPTIDEINQNPDLSEQERAEFISKLPEHTHEMADVMARLQSAGAIVVELRDERLNMPLSFPVLEYGLREGVNHYLSQNGSSLTLADIIAFNAENPSERIPYDQDLLVASQNNTLTPTEYAELVANNRQTGRVTLDDIFDQHQLDFILSRASELSTIAAVAGYPLFAVPSGYHTNGEPWGITFMGRYLSETNLLLAGYAYSKAGQPLRHTPNLEQFR